jgi:hypothetical protein
LPIKPNPEDKGNFKSFAKAMVAQCFFESSKIMACPSNYWHVDLSKGLNKNIICIKAHVSKSFSFGYGTSNPPLSNTCMV